MRSAGKGLVRLFFTVNFLFILTTLRAANTPPFEWGQFIGSQLGVSQTRVVANPAGGFYFYAQGGRPLIKFDVNHSMDWQITPEPGVNDIVETSSLDILPNGDLITLLYPAVLPQTRLFDQIVPSGVNVVAKLDSQGNPHWLRPVIGGWAFAVAAARDGAHYISGWSSGLVRLGPAEIATGSEAFFLARFDANSNLGWSIVGRSASPLDSAITALRAGPDGDVFIAGAAQTGSWTFGGTNLTGSGVFVGRVSTGGALRWLYLIPESRQFRAFDQTGDGPIYVAWKDSGQNYFVSEISQDGVAGWKIPIEGQPTGINSGALITVAGNRHPSSYFLTAINSQGLTVWEKGEPGRALNEAQCVAELNDGRLVVSGIVSPVGVFLDNVFVSDFSLLDGITDGFVATLNASSIARPQFSTQPIDQRALMGEAVTLQSDVYSSVAYSLQWFKGNDPVGNAGELSLHINGFQSADAGEYYVVAQNQFGASTSRIARLTGHSAVVSVLAGNGLPGYLDSMVLTEAGFNAPRHPSIFRDGSIYIADSSNHVIRRIDSTGVVTYAGQNKSGLATGAPTDSLFSSPSAVAWRPYSPDGSQLYVADSGNNAVRFVNVTSAATNVMGPQGTGAVRPITIAAQDALPFVIFAEENGKRIWKLLDGQITFLAGEDAGFESIAAVALDQRASIYVADKGVHSIFKINLSGNVTRLAGADAPGFVDGVGGAARFNQPSGLAVDADENIFVTEIGNNAIRKISPAGNVTTLAAGMFNAPQGLAVRADGSLVIADTGNHQIRELRFDPLTDEGPRLRISRLAGLTIELTGEPGEYWIESIDALPPAIDWQFEGVFIIDSGPVSQSFTTSDSTRFYRARRVN